MQHIKKLKRDALSAVIAAISLVIVVLIELPFAQTMLSPRLSWYAVLGILDTLACIFFWGEFYSGLRLADDKRKFVLAQGVLLLGAIPMVGAFRWLRLLRLVRLLRMARLGSYLLSTWSTWNATLARTPLQSIGTATFLLIALGSGFFYYFESHANELINSYWDAVWWCMVSASTVGYGDISPVTTGGRIVAMVVFLAGIGLLGSLTAAMATTIIKGPDPSGVDLTDVLVQLDRLEAKLDRISNVSE